MTSIIFDHNERRPGTRIMLIFNPLKQGFYILSITTEEVREYFSNFGPISSVEIEEDVPGIRYGTVYFDSRDTYALVLAHNKGEHTIGNEIVYVRRYPKPAKALFPHIKNDNSLLISISNELRHPDTLMSLVAPYLSCEDTCRCMQLNSYFYSFIDNNWRSMIKQKIYVDINQIEMSTIHVFYGKHFESWEVEFSTQQAKSVRIHENTLEVRTAPLRDLSLITFLNKHVECKEDTGMFVTYNIENSRQGLQLVLQALFLRFSLRRILINLRDDELMEAVELSAREYYHHPSKDMQLRFWIKKDAPVRLPHYEQTANALGAVQYTISQDCYRDNLTIDVSSLNTNSTVVHLFCTEWDPQHMQSLVTDWATGSRTVKGVQVHTITYIDQKWEHKFEKLCELLNIERVWKIMDGTFLIQWFIFRRNDGKALKVLLKLHRGYGGYLLVHEHDV